MEHVNDRNRRAPETLSAGSLTLNPLYKEVKTRLTRGLANGEWKPGEAIPSETRLAERFGAQPVDGGSTDVVAAVLAATRGVGADAVLLTLASDSDDPAHHAAAMSRQRGRIVLVGVTGLHLRREDDGRVEGNGLLVVMGTAQEDPNRRSAKPCSCRNARRRSSNGPPKSSWAS